VARKTNPSASGYNYLQGRAPGALTVLRATEGRSQ